jgi:hypothetical protein
MAISTDISANKMLSSYALFNATDIKQFIIDNLKSDPNNPFKDVDYLGSNINAFIDIIAVMLQQILFAYSVNAAETSFSSALLYENMSKIVSLLNYKTAGKQTSMLPVRLTIKKPIGTEYANITEFTIPKFLTANYNNSFVLLKEEPIQLINDVTYVDTIMYQGSISQSQIFEATGDEFELIILPDQNIKNGEKFISDNFFTVYVDENNDGKWIEYTETNSLFLESSIAEKYERRFTEEYGYEFKFGNGTYGKKLKRGARVVIYYIISNGEKAVIGNSMLGNINSSLYVSNLFNEIKQSEYVKRGLTTQIPLENISVANTGPSTAISYPESVTSIRKNAPRVFASQGRLFSLDDYRTFIERNFKAYCLSTSVMTNNEYTSKYLKYFYDLGLASPQKDSRINIAQVNFMTAVNFNNIYCFVVPAVNTIISGKIPNYINSGIKNFIADECRPYMGASHNLVLMDPIYKAFTFGSYNLDDDVFNPDQLLTKLVLVRNKMTKYSYSFIREHIIDGLKLYFKTLKLGSIVDIADITQIITSTPGVKSFYLEDVNGIKNDNLTFFTWNPLYKNEDNAVTAQSILAENFVYPYFYDIDNISNLIKIVDE